MQEHSSSFNSLITNRRMLTVVGIFLHCMHALHNYMRILSALSTEYSVWCIIIMIISHLLDWPHIKQPFVATSHACWNSSWRQPSSDRWVGGGGGVLALNVIWITHTSPSADALTSPALLASLSDPDTIEEWVKPAYMMLSCISEVHTVWSYTDC